MNARQALNELFTKENHHVSLMANWSGISIFLGCIAVSIHLRPGSSPCTLLGILVVAFVLATALCCWNIRRVQLKRS